MLVRNAYGILVRRPLEGVYLEDREGNGRIILAEFEGDDCG
jgi:hypothetical protein